MEDTKIQTSLSAGSIIRGALLEDEAVSAITRNVFPVVVDNARLPYIAYRRVSFEQKAQKTGLKWADTVEVEVVCYAASYEESIRLAEAVRAALDGVQYAIGDLNMRCCTLTGAEEGWQADAYIQRLVFTLKI